MRILEPTALEVDVVTAAKRGFPRFFRGAMNQLRRWKSRCIDSVEARLPPLFLDC